jgi:hypothetical protein
LKSEARKSATYKTNAVRVDEVRWDKGGIEPSGHCMLFFWYGNWSENHELRAEVFVLTLVVKRLEFVSDKISYMILKRPDFAWPNGR